MTKNEFYSAWLSCFAQGVSKKEVQKYVKSPGNYLWHIFSWELLDKNAFLAGDNAKKAFDRADKHDALYIAWFEDGEAKPLTAELGRADALERFEEVYVVASDFSWTYIKTHESVCGPYFMQL